MTFFFLATKSTNTTRSVNATVYCFRPVPMPSNISWGNASQPNSWTEHLNSSCPRHEHQQEWPYRQTAQNNTISAVLTTDMSMGRIDRNWVDLIVTCLFFWIHQVALLLTHEHDEPLLHSTQFSNEVLSARIRTYISPDNDQLSVDLTKILNLCSYKSWVAQQHFNNRLNIIVEPLPLPFSP